MTFRRGGRFVLGLAGLAALSGAIPAGASSPAPSPTPGPTSPPTAAEAALQQQANALEQQIMSLQLQSAPLLYDAGQAQQRAAAAQAQLAQEQLALANANVVLEQTTAHLGGVRAQLAADREQLAAIVLTMYEATRSNTVLTELANSKDLGQTVDALVSYSQITDSMTTLVQSVRADTDRLAHLQSAQQEQERQIQLQADAVQAQQDQALQDEAMYQRQAAKLTGPAAQLTAQLQGVLTNLAAAEGQQVEKATLDGLASGILDGALPPFAFGPRPDDFAWGQCTWYVASLVSVTWGGDAWTWISAAAAQNKPEGMTPKPGAIVVWSPGGGGSSSIGHVAFVETVVSPTSFIIDEANWQGLGVVDKRLVPTLAGVEGFIYPT
ncbi:MAG: CHAP domain-containing protein [Candidatus Dormibacteraeota bacterium]|nr:CHAP domain-containing protein [Candidatus Dormibacteraeota bacterium]